MTQRPLTFDAALPGDLEQPVADEVGRAQDEDVAGRLRAKDPTLWGSADTPELADRMGWLTIAERMRGQAGDLQRFARDCAADGLTDAVLLGMGGSSLAPEVLRRSFPEGPDGHLRLHVLDSTDPAAIAAVEQRVDLGKTLFVVSTKSGGTIETRSQAEYFWARQPDGRHWIAITDPRSAVEELSRERGFRRTFLGDPEIGGRYSALSPFGVVPAALIGAPLEELLDGALDPEAFDAGVWLGAALGALAKAGRDKLTIVVDDAIGSFGLWAEQLVAESTGKQGKGILPVAGEPVGAPDEYGDDRVFLVFGERGAEVDALGGAGHPVITVPLDGPGDLGRLFFLAEVATAVAGWSLGINPYDQPNVQEAKDNTNAVLEEGATTDEAADDDALRALLGGARPPAYVAILAYGAPDDAFEAQVAELRAAIRATTRATTTFGWGPRYLHSTGQLHKGGPANGRFLLLVAETAADLEVPGRELTFEQLKQAQALGDLRTLRSHGLPAERVPLDGSTLDRLRGLV